MTEQPVAVQSATVLQPSHVVAGSSGTVMLGAVLLWLFHWPLAPIDAPTALALAGLIVSAGGAGGLAYVQRVRYVLRDEVVPIVPPAPAPAPPVRSAP